MTGKNRTSIVVFGLCWLLVGMPSVAEESVSVTDFLGREVRLARPAQRIIALAPHIVENVYSAGAGKSMVAAVNYSDYPPAARKLPQLGSYKAISVEQVLARKPDLVIVWASGNGEIIIQQLERLGVPVYVDEPRKLEDIARSVRDISVLAGTEQHGEKAADKFLQSLDKLQQTYADAKLVTVFYQVWNEPLQTLNGEHLISDVITLCGGKNVYADAAVLAPKINIESVLYRDPDVIVASGMGEERPEWLEEWRQWSELKATRWNNLFFVPPDIIQRHTLRILDGAELFCQHIQTGRKHL